MFSPFYSSFLFFSLLFLNPIFLFSSFPFESEDGQKSLNRDPKNEEIKLCKEGIRVTETHLIQQEEDYQAKDPRTYLIHRLYNPKGNLLEISEEGEGRIKRTCYHYNAKNQLEKVVKPDGRCLSYSYNEEGEIIRFEAGDGSFCYCYHYNPSKELVKVEDLCHQLSQMHGWLGKEEWMEEQGPAMRLIYQNDEQGRRMGLKLPDSSQLIYSYEGDRIVGIERIHTDPSLCYVYSFVYDEHGSLISQSFTRKKDLVHYPFYYHYDTEGALVSMDSPWRQESIPEGGKDSSGRLLKVLIEEENDQEELLFQYTQKGLLANEKNHVYAYDTLFNRVAHQGKEWVINGLNQLVRTPDASYEYDANGNVIAKHTAIESILYHYDALDRLTQVEYPHEKAWTYLYDAFHRRIAQCLWTWSQKENEWKIESREWILYDGFKEIGKFSDKGECLELHVLGPAIEGRKEQAIAIELKGKPFLPVHNFLGSICSLVDPDEGGVVEKYTYSAYGEEEIFNGAGEKLLTSSIQNPWRFWGCHQDETGLLFFGKRYYSPEMGRWMTPDPLFFADVPNLYAFARNDPVNYYDAHGLFSIAHLWANLKQSTLACFQSLFQPFKRRSLRLPDSVNQRIDGLIRKFFGELNYTLMGFQKEETELKSYGDLELDDKVRVSFINGMLITKADMQSNLELLSESHGDVKIHYVFRPTEGFTFDTLRAAVIKLGFSTCGFRSHHAHLLAKKWRELIAEMGGVESGGTILHYAHSLGGSETDRARELLTPEEQKMIRVFTFGSATMIRDEGFSQVVNIVSINDGVCILDPLGRTRNYFDPESNIWFRGALLETVPLTDHLLQGSSYTPVIYELGEAFLIEFKKELEPESLSVTEEV